MNVHCKAAGCGDYQYHHLHICAEYRYEDMMYIVRLPNGDYQYHRRPTSVQYESRMGRGTDVQQARVFTTLSAAKNSDGVKLHSGKPIEVELHIKERTD